MISYAKKDPHDIYFRPRVLCKYTARRFCGDAPTINSVLSLDLTLSCHVHTVIARKACHKVRLSRSMESTGQSLSSRPAGLTMNELSKKSVVEANFPAAQYLRSLLQTFLPTLRVSIARVSRHLQPDRLCRTIDKISRQIRSAIAAGKKPYAMTDRLYASLTEAGLRH